MVIYGRDIQDFIRLRDYEIRWLLRVWWALRVEVIGFWGLGGLLMGFKGFRRL